MTRIPLVAAPLALALASCGSGATGDAGNQATTAAAAPGGTAVSDLPPLRPGLWKTTVIAASRGVNDEPEENCVGPGASLVESFGIDDTNQCSRRDIRQSGSGYAIDIACSGKDANGSLKGSFSGDFNNVVTGDLTIGLGLPGEKMDYSHVRYEARYAGACTPEDAQ